MTPPEDQTPPSTKAKAEPTITDETVRHIAGLARLRLDDDAVARNRADLQQILSYIAKLNEVDVRDVEPLAHPMDMTNRLADDEPGDLLPREVVLNNAPAVQDDFITVPKVIGDS